MVNLVPEENCLWGGDKDDEAILTFSREKRSCDQGEGIKVLAKLLSGAF